MEPDRYVVVGKFAVAGEADRIDAHEGDALGLGVNFFARFRSSAETTAETISDAATHQAHSRR